MHLIEVIPCGPLKDKYPSLKISGDSVADAIEGWSRQVDPSISDVVLEVVDFETEEKLREPTDVTTIYVYPAMRGGGAFGRIVLGAVMVAAALIVGLSNPIGAALLVSGALTMAMGVMSLFMKAPTMSKEEDPDPSKYIGAGTNTTKIGTTIGIGGGRMLIGGHYLSVQVNSSEMVYGRFPGTPT